MAQEPWRYLYALVQATIEKAEAPDGPSRTKICKTFAAIAMGRPARVGESFQTRNGTAEFVREDFRERWLSGKPILVVHRRWDDALPHQRAALRQSGPPGANWRNNNVFHPHADDISRQLNLWLNASAENPNRAWLEGMTKVFLHYFSGARDGIERAEAMAEAIGEDEYFHKRLLACVQPFGPLMTPQQIIQLMTPLG